MQLSHYKLEFKWGLVLLLLVLVPLGVSLGLWQMNRAAEKEVMENLRQQNNEVSRTRLSSRDIHTESMLYRQVSVEGKFDLKQQILLDNRKHGGTPGYHVYTPMHLAGSETWVMVNRGWVRQGDDRRFLPALPGPDSSLHIEGRVENVPAVGIKLGLPGESGSIWPKRVIYFDMDWIRQETGYNLLPYVVYQTSQQDDGLLRDWTQQFNSKERMTPEKHMGYALQWFSLTLLAIVMFFILSIRKPGKEAETGEQ